MQVTALVLITKLTKTRSIQNQGMQRDKHLEVSAIQLSLTNHVMHCITANVLQTKVDAQCDKLATELS